MAYNYEALKDAMLSMPLAENEEIIDLSQFDLIVINSSGGKDSVCAIFEICRLAKEQNFPFDRIHVSHQDLGKNNVPFLVLNFTFQNGETEQVTMKTYWNT